MGVIGGEGGSKEAKGRKGKGTGIGLDGENRRSRVKGESSGIRRESGDRRRQGASLVPVYDGDKHTYINTLGSALCVPLSAHCDAYC